MNITGYDRIVERLVHYDEGARELAYELIEGTPGFILLSRNHWTTLALDEGTSAVRMDVTVTLKPLMGALVGWMMEGQVRKELRRFQAELKEFAETGQISEAKRARRGVIG